MGSSKDQIEQVQLHKCTRRETEIQNLGASYSFKEIEGYSTAALSERLNSLLAECDAVAAQNDIEVDESVETACRHFTDLLAFPIPSVYLDGEKKWCFDWDDREDGKGVYSRLETSDKLLVIVDEGDRHLRLPCLLGKVDPLRHLRYGLLQVYDE